MTHGWKLVLALGLAMTVPWLGHRPAQAAAPVGQVALSFPEFYLEPNNGMSLIFPSGWDLRPGTGARILTATRPLEDVDDEFHEQVTVTRAPATTVSLEAAYRQELKAIREEAAGFSLLKEGAIADKHIKWVRYTGHLRGYQVEVISCVLLNRQSAYRIDLVTQPARFQQYNKVFSDIIRSVQFNVKGKV